MADGFRRHESKMPRIGETDGVPFEDKDIWLHFFRLESDSHWMAAESNGGAYTSAASSWAAILRIPSEDTPPLPRWG